MVHILLLLFSHNYVLLFATPWTATHQVPLFFTISQSLPKLISIGDTIQPSYPLMPSPLSALNLSQHQGLFQLVSCSHQVTKILALQLPSNEYSGLISLKIHWFDLRALQGTFRSLLQHHSLKASIFWHSAFFTIWLSQPFVIALTT